MSQDREFVAAVVRNLPEPPGKAKQWWVGNPQKLAKALRETLCPPKWRENRSGEIYLEELVSDGTTGEEWVAWFEENGFQLDEESKSVLRSEEFKPTKGVVYNIVALRETQFSHGCDTRGLHVVAGNFTWRTPHVEVACLIRKSFSDEELEAMGLVRIVVMHEPVEDSDGPRLLAVHRGDGGNWLAACQGSSERKWRSTTDAFAFLAPRES